METAVRLFLFLLLLTHTPPPPPLFLFRRYRPVYGPKEAHALAESLGWTVKPDGEYFRRVVPSPQPREILQIEAVRTILEHLPGTLAIACGGGGIPVSRVPSRPQTLQGVEAVIDKVRILSRALALDDPFHFYSSSPPHTHTKDCAP
jgi:carbamate kinase